MSTVLEHEAFTNSNIKSKNNKVILTGSCQLKSLWCTKDVINTQCSIASLLEQETHRGNPNTHGGCYDYYHRTRIVAAADMSDQRRQAFGVRWDVSGLYKDWQEMLDVEDLDLLK